MTPLHRDSLARRHRWVIVLACLLIILTSTLVLFVIRTYLTKENLATAAVLVDAGAQVIIALGALIAGIGAVAIGWRFRQRQHEEAEARADLALDISAKVNVYQSGEFLFIETVVLAKNPSRRKWSIPAVYVSYKALIDTHSPTPFTGKEVFDDLPTLDGVVEVRNRAFLPKSVWVLAPDEPIPFSRIDRLPKAFGDRYPVLWINIEVFGTSYELLGPPKTRANRMGEIRREWIKFMTEVEKEPTSYVVFGRLDPTQPSPWQGFDPGDRCLLSLQNGTPLPDEGLSRKWRDVLQSVSQWTLDQTSRIRPS